MKVVAYSIKPFEKGCLAKANTKKHDITLISNALSVETAMYAEGKDAVIVFTNDDVSKKVINILAGYGIKFITTRSVGTDHIDKEAAAKHGIKLANVPNYSPQVFADKDPLLEELMALTNVLVTPHQALLTNESLQQIAIQTIRNLDLWQQGANCRLN